MHLDPLQGIDMRAIEKRLPQNVLEWLKANGPKVCVAGGFIRSIVASERVQDIDVFISGDADSHVKALAKRNGHTSRSSKTQNAVTIFSKPVIQVITRWTFDRPEQVVESFDFTIASAAFWWSGNGFVGMAHPRFYSDLAAKRLHYLSPVRSEDAGGSMLRVLKFYQRDYRIPLDSLARVVARLCGGVKWDQLQEFDEDFIGRILTGLLFEVDPHATPDEFILESESEAVTETLEGRA